MNWGEIAGYGASLLVFATFYTRGMLTLRVIAIASNAAFIAYALCDGLMPVLLLHSALLPLNVARLVELRRRAAEIDSAAAAGYLAPVAGAVAQEFIDLAAVLNALRAAIPPRSKTDF